MPSTFVLTAFTIVPETFASPESIDEFPTLFEAALSPVGAPWLRSFTTAAVFIWLVLSVLYTVTAPVFVEFVPFSLLTIVAPPESQQAPVEAFRLPTFEMMPSDVASPVSISVSPTFPEPPEPSCDSLCVSCGIIS